MVQRGKEWGKVVGKVVYSMNLGRGQRGNEGGKLYSMNLGRGSKRNGMGESSAESCIA